MHHVLLFSVAEIILLFFICKNLSFFVIQIVTDIMFLIIALAICIF